MRSDGIKSKIEKYPAISHIFDKKPPPLMVYIQYVTALSVKIQYGTVRKNTMQFNALQNTANLIKSKQKLNTYYVHNYYMSSISYLKKLPMNSPPVT